MPSSSGPLESSRTVPTELMSILGGVATTAAVVGILLWVYHAFGIDISSFSVLFVLPLGAALSGMIAASGYSSTGGFLRNWSRRNGRRTLPAV